MMDYYQVGRAGLIISGISAVAAWLNFQNGNAVAVLLSAIIGVMGILTTLSAVVKEQ